MLKGGSDSRYLLQADEVDWQSTRSEPLYHNSPIIENSLKYARSGATHTKIKDPRMFFGISTQPTQSASVMGQSLLSLR